MSDSAENLSVNEKVRAEKLKEEGMFNPQDLVSKGDYTGNPRDIVGNPAVAPQTFDQVEELRDDLLAEAEDNQ